MAVTTVRIFQEAEVKCFHCGGSVGLIRRERTEPPAPASFLSAVTAEPAPFRRITDIHCHRCGGSTFADEFFTRHALVVVEGAPPAKRGRGRPPKQINATTAAFLSSSAARPAVIGAH